MSVESAADRATFLSPDDFGATVTWSHGGTVVEGLAGIWEAPARVYSGAETVDSVGVQATFTCAIADLPAGAGQGDTIDRDGVSYTVREFLPDGTGMVRADLERLRA